MITDFLHATILIIVLGNWIMFNAAPREYGKWWRRQTDKFQQGYNE